MGAVDSPDMDGWHQSGDVLMRIDYEQMEFIHPKLRLLMRWVEDKYDEGTWTSLYRIGDDGVHGQLPLRGADRRERDKGRGEAIEKEVNRHWVYDPDRPHIKCCVAHGKGSNYHLHFQVHDNTGVPAA